MKKDFDWCSLHHHVFSMLNANPLLEELNIFIRAIIEGLTSLSRSLLFLRNQNEFSGTWQLTLLESYDFHDFVYLMRMF